MRRDLIDRQINARGLRLSGHVLDYEGNLFDLVKEDAGRSASARDTRQTADPLFKLLVESSDLRVVCVLRSRQIQLHNQQSFWIKSWFDTLQLLKTSDHQS